MKRATAKRRPAADPSETAGNLAQHDVCELWLGGEWVRVRVSWLDSTRQDAQGVRGQGVRSIAIRRLGVERAEIETVPGTTPARRT